MIKLVYFLFFFHFLVLFETKHSVDPAFRLMRFPLEGELDFDFEK